MSKHFNRQRFNKSNGNREYKSLMRKFLYPCHEDCSEDYTKMLKTRFNRPIIYSYEMRRFRTWKYNRKTQYKSTNE